jgi:hypothetical protein
MNKKDLSNLSKIYVEKVINEININSESDFGDLEGSKFGRYKGRHFKKSPIPKSRKDYIPSSEREPNNLEEPEYTETYGEEESSIEVDVPQKRNINELSRDERHAVISRMSIIRSEIDENKSQSEQLQILSNNRKLMDEIISDLVLGFSDGKNVSLTHVTVDGDPIFSIGGDPIFAIESENILVSLTYGKYTNPEDVVYKKVNI